MAEPDRKRKKPNYFMNKKRKQYVLEPGLRGFLCTCNFREKESVRESYNLLNFYADALKPAFTPAKDKKESNPESTTSARAKDEESNHESAVSVTVADKKEFDHETTTFACVKDEKESHEPTASDGDEDIADELFREIKTMKAEDKPSQRRFQVVESGAKNILFIRTTVDNPVEIVTTLMESIIESKQQKARYLLRLIPIETTCKANMDEINKAMSTLIDKHFSGDTKTFAINFNHRNNHQINRDDVIKEIAKAITAKNSQHKVDLKNAELTVVVEIIRGICLLSVIPYYVKYKKYNLLQLFESVTKSDTETKSLQEDK